MSTRNPRNNALLAFTLLAVAGFLSISAVVRTASGAEIVVSEAQQLHHGKVLYATYCAGCHGEAGDGKGPAASMLIVKPRDFTSGLYKFR